MSADDQKQAAALAALEYIEDGMTLGLGTGSTAAKFVDALGEKVAGGLTVTGVPTSNATAAQAELLGIPLTTLSDVPMLDITVDGADELDSQLRLIKGGGGALLREKIVATASKSMIVIADASKKVGVLGEFPLPVEIVPFGARATCMMIEAASRWAGAEGPMTIRKSGSDPFLTDNGNLICDCAFGRIEDPEKLMAALASIAGVVDHGLFIGIAKVALIGTPDGVETLTA